MSKEELNIGRNISEVRKSKGLSQEKLAGKCGFSNTTLSQYENSKKVPTVSTLGKIARQLGVSIDRLYFGDENKSFVGADLDVGRRIVNAVYLLWSEGIISSAEDYYTVGYIQAGEHKSNELLFLHKYQLQINRLVKSLEEYYRNKETYEEPNKYLEILLASVAKDINDNPEEDKRATIIPPNGRKK